MSNSQCHVFFRRFTISILLITLIVLCFIIYGVHHFVSTPPDVCHSNECLRSAAAFKQYMDLTIDPCDDFYGYVCGNWADGHPRLVGNSKYSWFSEGQLRINRSIRDRLERNVASSDPKPVQLAKIMYRSCLNTEAHTNESVRAITEILQEFGLPTLPTLLNHTKATFEDYTFDWIATVAKIKRKLGLNVLIVFGIESDREDRNRNRLTFGSQYRSTPSLLTFPDYEWSKLHSNHYEDSTSPVEENESNYVSQTANMLLKMAKTMNPGIDETKLEASFTTLGEIYVNFTIPFNTQFKQVPEVSEEYDLETDYTVQELQNITDANIVPDAPYPIWQHYLEELFVSFSDAKPTQEDKLQMSKRNIDSMKWLVKMISKQPLQVIELYIWGEVTRHIIEHKYYKPKTEEDCTEMVRMLMGLAVNYMFADNKFVSDTKPRVAQMLNGIRDEFNQMVLEADWMDADTKHATLEKSNSMKSLIGFPEWILDVEKLEEHYRKLQIEKDLHLQNWVSAIEFLVKDWLKTWRRNNEKYINFDPMVLNAYYIPRRNTMYIPVAYIQYPAYFLGLEVLNYGTLGNTMGHELTHGFDDSGRNYDKDGSSNRWWSNESMQEYEKRANCFVEQYSRYYLADAEGFVNGYRTLDENIADNGGIREAFRAYRAHVKRNGLESKLPGFEDFSHEQLFFISFAHEHCSTVNPAQAKKLLEPWHSPLEFRVKGVLSNMPEFSEVFQCPTGKAMNPEKKCRIW